jgi:hypothetical protein
MPSRGPAEPGVRRLRSILTVDTLRNTILLRAWVAIFLLAMVVHAQAPSRSFKLGDSALPTAEDLIQQLGSEDDARTIVYTVLDQELGRTRPPLGEQARFLSAQVRPDWVPWRPAINMAVLDDDTAADVYRRCGYFFTLHPAVVAEGAVILPIALGNRCGSIERRYRLQRTATGWQAELLPAAEGWAVAHCGCS